MVSFKSPVTVAPKSLSLKCQAFNASTSQPSGYYSVSDTLISTKLCVQDFRKS